MSGIFAKLLTQFTGEEQQSGGAVHSALTDVLGLDQPNGLTSLLQQFQSSNLGQHVESWVSVGQNLPITAEDVQNALSNQQVQSLVQRTGLPVDALMPLVAKILPHAVDAATPDGQAPQATAPGS